MIWNKVGFESWTPHPQMAKIEFIPRHIKGKQEPFFCPGSRYRGIIQMETLPNRGVLLVDADYIDSIQNCV